MTTSSAAGLSAVASYSHRKRPRFFAIHKEQSLSELFSERQWSDEEDQPSDSSASFRGLHQQTRLASFFTFRLEHREAPNGEERFLLFRSDQAGCIAKIIFSTLTLDQTDDNSTDTVRAQVAVLNVKEPYRGKDFGGLLFTLAMDALRERYVKVDCLLYAEEDMARHNRLVDFYQNLNCRIKPDAKIQYLHNNDGEMYRKIPMIIHLQASSDGHVSEHLMGRNFLPLDFMEALGNTPLRWLMVEDGAGHVEFCTTHGEYLEASAQGNCTTSHTPSEKCAFDLQCVPDASLGSHGHLWILQSCANGTYLSMQNQHLICSQIPKFWKFSNGTMMCTNDTPYRRQHYRLDWMKQTMHHVQEQRRRFFKFQLARMTLKEALDMAHELPANPFDVSNDRGVSLRTLCFATAQAAQTAGLPDWVQLVALVCHLGRVVSLLICIDDDDDDDEYDWTVPSKSRVLGCVTPHRVSLGEFQSHCRDDHQYATTEGIYALHCGLDQCILTWTGPEYLYYMLQHNHAALPPEGLAMIRYFTLGDWHTYNEYAHLTTEQDQELQCFVAEFDSLRCSVDFGEKDKDQEECNSLWLKHYQNIAAKYDLEGTLEW